MVLLQRLQIPPEVSLISRTLRCCRRQLSWIMATLAVPISASIFVLLPPSIFCAAPRLFIQTCRCCTQFGKKKRVKKQGQLSQFHIISHFTLILAPRLQTRRAVRIEELCTNPGTVFPGSRLSPSYTLERIQCCRVHPDEVNPWIVQRIIILFHPLPNSDERQVATPVNGWQKIRVSSFGVHCTTSLLSRLRTPNLIPNLLAP